MRYKNEHAKIVEICETAITFTEVEGRLGISTPSNSLRRYIKVHKISMPNYGGCRVAYQNSIKSRSFIGLEHLCKNSETTTGSIKRFLIKSGLKLEKCEECGWCKKRGSDQKIPVQLHHKNGDTSDNRLENLTILCPNCHSLTENYCGKNKANSRRRSQFEQQKEYYQTPKNTCTVCGKLGYGTAFCSNECRGMSQRVTERPSKEQLEIEIESFSWVALGKKYGVSDKAVRKWAISYGILL